MLGTVAGKASSLNETPRKRGKTGLIHRKVWLPKLVYSALPFFYLASGVAAFLATVYINEWFWVLPHYLLFSAACLHLALLVYRRRRRKPTADPKQD